VDKIGIYKSAGICVMGQLLCSNLLIRVTSYKIVTLA